MPPEKPERKGGLTVTLISSRENPLVKAYGRLCASKAFRASGRRFAIEGARLCGDALESAVPIESAFLTREAVEKYGGVAQRLLQSSAQIYEISQPVAQKMADTQNPQGIFCIARMLDKPMRLDKININGAYIALENLQDPGNLGTVLRTAEALGLSGVILSPGCADVYSPKVLRGAMGAVFRLPFAASEDFPGLLRALSQKGVRTVAAVADRSAVSVLEAELSHGAVAAIGNEGAGLTQESVAACAQRVTIPMGGRAQSLNASAAATILMWEICRRRV